MKKYILIIALLFCGFVVSNASILTKQSIELAVGSNPVSILENPSDGMIHIFCAGIDANDNNIYDEGEDEKPSWWTYNPAGSSVEPTMVKEFDNYFVSPFKPMIDNINSPTGSIAIPFACDKVSEWEYKGNSKLEIIDMTTFEIISVDSVSDKTINAEYLFSKYQTLENNNHDKIEILRQNLGDYISYVNGQTGESFRFGIGGNAIDFAFVDVNDDGILEIAILLDNKKLQFYKFDENYEINFISEFDLTTFPTYTGEFGRLQTYGNFVYTNFRIPNDTIADWHKTLRFNVDPDDKVKYKIIEYYTDLVDIDMNTYPLTETQMILTNSSHNALVYEHYNTSEMHRTSSGSDLVYANENTVYISSSNKILIYDYTNEANKDELSKYIIFCGYQPLDLFYHNDRVSIVSLGIDFNFDGIIDERIGDQKASIYSLDPTFKLYADDYIRKEIEFDFPINFPLNTNMSSDGNIALPSDNSIHYYNVEDKKVNDSFDAGMYVSCAFSVLDYLVLGQRDYTENKSYIRIKKGDFIDVKTEVGANVIDCIVYQNASGFGVVSLSEGNFGQPDAKINIIKLSTMGIGENTAIDVGTGGNSIVVDSTQTKAAIVMNGSHEIHILDLLQGTIIKTFSTGTSGYGGPRDAKFVGEVLFVTTYSNKILVFNYNTGRKVASIKADGNIEGLTITDKYLFASNIDFENYQPSNRLYVYDLDKLTSVEESTLSEQTIRVYPHPVSNDFHLVSDDLAGTNDIAIINSQGKIVATHSGSSNGAIALNADALGLGAGNYTAVINGTRAVRFVVIK